MKAAYITGTFPCVSESFIAREISALTRRGIEITVFSLKGSGFQPDNRCGPASVIYRPALLSFISVRDFCVMLFSRPGTFFLGFKNAVRQRPEDMGIVSSVRHFLTAISFTRAAASMGIEHIHAHFAFVTADIASAMGAMLGMRYTLSVHAWDLYTQTDDSVSKRVLGAAHVLACTDHGRERVISAAPGILQERVTVMRHGLEPHNWTKADGEKSNVILSVGRLVKKKGFLTLIDACRRLRDLGVDFSCLIIGDGPERSNLEQVIEETDLSDRVMLRGEITGSDLHAEFMRAAVFTLPSVVGECGDRDGLPNTVLEAMASSLPVIVTTASAASEVVQNGESGYIVEPNDSSALAERIQALLDNRDICQRMGDSGRKVIESQFDIDENVEIIVELFKSLASERYQESQ